MRGFNMPPQLVRLCLVTIGIVGVYLAARFLLTPVSFGEFGFYRGQALEEIATRLPVFSGRQACDECHTEVTQTLSNSQHKTIGCETCHGVGQAHVEDPDVKTVRLTDHLCLRCHEELLGRPGWMRQIKPKEHYPGDRCTECHFPHQPNESP